MSAEQFRWGIIGPGKIARKFANGLSVIKDARLAAVASRNQLRAEAFASEFGVPKAYGCYEAILADPDIDAVYISTPHPMHLKCTLDALDAGKPVLCEKPFAMNAVEAAQAIAAARARGVFLMEAMWTRFFPAMAAVRERLAAGVIGQPRMVQADFGFRTDIDPEGRLFNTHLGGGGLLDVGVYPISFASMVLGTPDRVTGLAHVGETGVDEQAACVLGYRGGELAVLCCAMRTNTQHEAWIHATEGAIHLLPPFWIPRAFTVELTGKDPQRFDFPAEGNGYNHQAEEVARLVRAGETQSAVMPLDETLAIMKIMDELGAQWGLKYPMEAATQVVG
jgi:predicted dehydrogenase